MGLMGFLGGKDDKKKSSKKLPKKKSGSKKSSSSKSRRSSRQMAMPKKKAPAEAAAVPAQESATRGGLSVGSSPAGARPESTVSGRRKRTSMKNKQLGQLLIKSEAITNDHLDKALATQAQKGGLIGQILMAMDACNKGDIGSSLRKQRTITTVELVNVNRDEEAIGQLDRDFCTKNRLFPFEKIGNQLCVAMSNVLDTQAKNDIKEKTSMQLKTFDAGWTDIQEAIKKHYSDEDEKAPKKSIAEQAAEEEVAKDSNFDIKLPDEDSVILDDIEEVVEDVVSPVEEVVEDVTLSVEEVVEDMALPVEEVVEDAPLHVEEVLDDDSHQLRSVPTEEELEVISPEEILAQLKAKHAADKAAKEAAAEAKEAPLELAPVELTEEAPLELAPIELVEEAPSEVADSIELLEVDATPALIATALPVGVLKAIPVSNEFLEKAVVGDVVVAENRWLAEHTLDNELPVVSAPFVA